MDHGGGTSATATIAVATTIMAADGIVNIIIVNNLGITVNGASTSSATITKDYRQSVAATPDHAIDVDCRSPVGSAVARAKPS